MVALGMYADKHCARSLSKSEKYLSSARAQQRDDSRVDSLGAKLHNGRGDSFRLHECTLDVEWECEWFLAKFSPLLIGPSDLGLSRDGKDDPVQVDSIKD